MLVALALVTAVDSVVMAVIYVLVMGISGGAHHIVQGVIWAHYYGRHGLGRVQGSAMTISFCASAIGPLPLAIFHDLTGTYTLGIVMMMTLPVLSVLALAKTRPGGMERVEETDSKTP